MKKIFLACMIFAAAFIVLSCSGKKEEPAAPVPVPEQNAGDPIIDITQAPRIDEQLAKYDEVVARYLEALGSENPDTLTSAEEELARVSEELSALATDFSTEQLQTYNDITAKLSF